MPERKVGRPPKDHVAVNIKMDAELAKKLQNFCEKNGHSKTWLIESAVRECIEKKEK